jgi:hypothetical protein
MQSVKASALRRAMAICFAALSAVSPAHAACQFAPVKQQIDIVLDRDAAKAAKFRSEVSSGADSLAVMDDLVSPERRDMLDICRFEAAEYLTKRGFPPYH